jgi:zinc transport system ATP-binding protein
VKDILLELKDVFVEIGNARVVEKISVSIERGSVVGIIGPNGGGKTTLLKAILGLVPYGGSIKVRPNTKIGYVPQYFDFDRSLPLTVRELFRIRMGVALTSRTQDAAVKQQLADVGAAQVFSKRLGVLSGGELQRVLIGLALIRKPELLLLDEPSSAIDVGGEDAIYNLIDELAQRYATTVVFVSHDLAILKRFASHALCINKRMMCFGSPHAVLTERIIARTHGQLAIKHHHA